jgi:16S rRNA processing protein RimM
MARERSSEDRLIVAELGPAHGIRGEITARVSGVPLEELSTLRGLVLRRPDGSERPTAVLGARRKKRTAILALEGIADRAAAEAHRGAVVLARRDALPALGDDEWWVADLVGATVVTGAGEELGVLEEVLELPANDVFVVRGERGEVLLPVTAEVVKRVDVASRRVIVELLPGLLEASRGAGAGEGEDA